MLDRLLGNVKSELSVLNDYLEVIGAEEHFVVRDRKLYYVTVHDWDGDPSMGGYACTHVCGSVDDVMKVLERNHLKPIIDPDETTGSPKEMLKLAKAAPERFDWTEQPDEDDYIREGMRAEVHIHSLLPNVEK